jgi:ribosomal protein S18 acetylase RimI-like enzyme
MLFGYQVRPATVDDAQIIFEVQSAHETPLIGGPNGTLEDVLDELVEPGFNPETDGWLVLADPESQAAGDVITGVDGVALEGGQPRVASHGPAIAWGWACRKGTSDNIDISVYTRPGHEPVAAWLWDKAEARAAEIGRELGHSTVTVDIGVFPEDSLIRDIAAGHGFEQAATFVRMRIDHPGLIGYPETPPGVELRHGHETAVRRDAIVVRNEAFADHFGYVPKTYEEWSRERESSSAHDWNLVHVAYCEGEPAAVAVRTNNFVPDENCGYVLTLGTSPKYQGRGLGSYLLRHAFAADAEQGRVGTILHVDTNPHRPALGLYQRNGMHEVRTIDVWRKHLRVQATLGKSV